MFSGNLAFFSTSSKPIWAKKGANKKTPAPSDSIHLPSKCARLIDLARSGTSAPLMVRPLLSCVRRGSLGKPSSANTRSTVLTETSTPSCSRSSAISPAESCCCRHSMIFCRTSGLIFQRAALPSPTGSAISILPWRN